MGTPKKSVSIPFLSDTDETDDEEQYALAIRSSVPSTSKTYDSSSCLPSTSHVVSVTYGDKNSSVAYRPVVGKADCTSRQPRNRYSFGNALLLDERCATSVKYETRETDLLSSTSGVNDDGPPEIKPPVPNWHNKMKESKKIASKKRTDIKEEGKPSFTSTRGRRLYRHVSESSSSDESPEIKPPVPSEKHRCHHDKFTDRAAAFKRGKNLHGWRNNARQDKSFLSSSSSSSPSPSTSPVCANGRWKNETPCGKGRDREHQYYPYMLKSAKGQEDSFRRTPRNTHTSKRNVSEVSSDEKESTKRIKTGVSSSAPSKLTSAGTSKMLTIDESGRESKHSKSRSYEGLVQHRPAAKVVSSRLFEVALRDVRKSRADQTPCSPPKQPSRKPTSESKPNSHLPSYNASELRLQDYGTTFIDTHCHLDFLFQRVGHYGSFASYKKQLVQEFPISYEGCVSIFCDPSTFFKRSLWRPLIEEDSIWGAFGCHPHNAMEYDAEVHEALVCALEHDKVVALGEIGLDYSSRNTAKSAVQKIVFRQQLALALEKKLPLVIHCREAYDDCLEIMKEMVPTDYKIHLHCFTDSWDIAKTWLSTFSKLFIGITNVVTFPSAEKVHEVVRKLPLNRLLLETDAPYFLPISLPKSWKWSHPGMAIHVAAQITALKDNVTLRETLSHVRANTYFMYGI